MVAVWHAAWLAVLEAAGFCFQWLLLNGSSQDSEFHALFISSDLVLSQLCWLILFVSSFLRSFVGYDIPLGPYSPTYILTYIRYVSV